LQRAPSLVEAEVADDVRRLPATIGTDAREQRGQAVAERDAAAGAVSARIRTRLNRAAGFHAGRQRRAKRRTGGGVGTDDLRQASGFGRDRGREAVAELRRIGRDQPARVARIRRRIVAPVLRRRRAEAVEERLRQTEREARPLDEGAVRAELVRGRVNAEVVGVDADGDIGAHRAVGGLVTRIGRDVTARRAAVVVGGAAIRLAVERAGRAAAAVSPEQLLTDPATDLQAHVGARDVIEPHTVQAANLHVLDRFGLDGKIGRLRPSDCDDARRGAEEKAFHHLHLEPPNIVYRERVPYPPSATGTDGTPPCSPLAGETFHTTRSTQSNFSPGLPLGAIRQTG